MIVPFPGALICTSKLNQIEENVRAFASAALFDEALAEIDRIFDK